MRQIFMLDQIETVKKVKEEKLVKKENVLGMTYLNFKEFLDFTCAIVNFISCRGPPGEKVNKL